MQTRATVLPGSLSGGGSPLYDIAMILSRWNEGRIKLSELITQRHSLDEINEGMKALCKAGAAASSSCTSSESTGERARQRQGKVAAVMPNAILDPTGTVTTSAAKPAAPRAPRLASLRGKRVGLLINTKQNARPFLEEVGRLLEDEYGVTLSRRTKVNFAVPEPEDIIKELAAANDAVITGVGDCGSCSAAATADGVVLEAAGVPVAAIITDSFIPTANAMAALRGAPGYKYATTAHPVAVLTEDKIKERAAQVLGDVVALLTDDKA